MMAMFATGSDFKHPPTEDVAEKGKLSKTLFCPDKGYVNTRDRWSDEGTLFTFRCRMDKYATGHVHPDVNSFELYADGVEWFADLGKFELPNDFHQTILIDGIGGGGSSRAQAWPSMPGKMVDFRETDEVMYASGDAKTFYSYVKFPPRWGDLNHLLEKKPIDPKDFKLTWADFVYGKTRDEVPEQWRHEPNLSQGNRHVHTFYPVEKAFRSVLFIRGKYTYALIIDDIDKDGTPRDYQWVGNTRPGHVAQKSKSGKSLIVQQIKEPEKQLLVQLLDVEGVSQGPYFKKHKILAFSSGKADVHQVLIDAKKTNNPRFKTLLYPFSEGAPMPKVTKRNDRYVIEFPDQKDEIIFTNHPDGRSIPEIKRNGLNIFRMK
jgi:hypothetical protein